MVSFVDKILAPFQIALKKNVESYIRLETADDQHTFAAIDGSLVSVVRIDGCRQIIGEEEFRGLITQATLKIGSRFDQQGHALQVTFMRDPGRVVPNLRAQIRPVQTTLQQTGLDMDDLLDEKVRHLANFLTHEECYFVLWTRPSILTRTEMERSAKESREKMEQNPLKGGFAQNVMAALEPLRTRHSSFSKGLLSALDEIGIRAELLDVHAACNAIRNNLYPSKSNEQWRACLPGDPIPARAPMSSVDMSDILWPPLRQQLAVGDAKIVGERFVQIGDIVYGGADITLAPLEPSPFPMLLNRLFEAKIPYRISFMIEGGGAYSMQLRTFLSSIMGVTNSLNKQIKYSLEGLAQMARSEPVVRLRVSLATWARRDEARLIQDRMSVLLQAVESWGYCQVSDLSGDPLDCVMSSAMGIHCSGTAPTAIAPLAEVMKLLPWQRPSSPFEKGPIILRTPDGKMWPYQTGTNVTTTWFDLIFAQPGAGKSVLMNSLNLGTILSPGLSKLPFIATIDIGPSSSGLISLIQEALPPGRKHEAGYFRLQMSHEYAINPFDTQLGMRQPLMDERSYLTELLTLLCTPPGQSKPYDGMQQLAGLVVDEMFRWRDDTLANAEPRAYLPRIDTEIDEAIASLQLHLPTDPYWWDIVDRLFEKGEYRLATLAQRHAVPTLQDAITAARRPQIKTLLEQTQIGGSSEGILSAFERMITTAVREYPILAGITRFDIAETRICSLDLMDVSPQGDESADRQTAIMYMLARHVLVRGWWMGEDSLRQIPDKYRLYHEKRLQDYAETPKRLCYDEFHRTSKSLSVRKQVVRDVREGRKRGVQIVLASQMLGDFDDEMIDLATGVWVLGTAVSDKAVDDVRDRFGLSQTARNVVRHRLTGPRAGGAPALLVLGTTEGRYEQHLINTLGPIELWALSTSTEDVLIRNRLYARLGARRARQILAANFPGGSARSELKRRIMMRADSNQENRNAALTEVIDDLVTELVEASQREFYDASRAAAGQNTANDPDDTAVSHAAG